MRRNGDQDGAAGVGDAAGRLTDARLREFAERGFLVVPNVVPPETVAAASRVVDELVDWLPPGPETRGNHFYFPTAKDEPDLLAPLTATPAWDLAEALTGAGSLVPPWQVQVALNIPPFPHRPGRPHIDGDGLNYPRAQPPGTFTLLAAVLLTEQSAENCGNLWVWPGTHLTHAAFFRERGPDAFSAYPDVDLPEPEQVLGRPGDLLLAHYLLGHNVGGNYASDRVRRALYYRVKRTGHAQPADRWRDFLQDPWLDYDPIRELISQRLPPGGTVA